MSVAALRGESGADFEGNAAVLRGAPKKNILKRALPLFFDERDFVSYGEVRNLCVAPSFACVISCSQQE